MSAWGPEIFSDDTACDIRDEYRELLEDQVPDDEASWRVVEAYRHLDEDEEHVAWLALAATQSRLGRLDPQVKARALDMIDTGRGLRPWHEADGKASDKRNAELLKLRTQLTGPQPPRKIVRRPWRHITDLQPGDVLSFTASGGQVALLRVTRIADHRVGAAPILQRLDCRGPSLPPEEAFDRLAAGEGYASRSRPATYRVGKYRKKDPDWRDSDFVLAGRVPPISDDDQAQPRWHTAWTALRQTLERELNTGPTDETTLGQ